MTPLLSPCGFGLPEAPWLRVPMSWQRFTRFIMSRKASQELMFAGPMSTATLPVYGFVLAVSVRSTIEGLPWCRCVAYTPGSTSKRAANC